MINKTITITKILVSLTFLLSFSTNLCAQYTNFRLIEPREGDEPQPRAIIWTKDKHEALIHYNDEQIVAVDDVRLDKEWKIKEIKRESIIFGRTSQKRYIEYYIDPSKRPNKRYSSCSFFSLPISLFEALQLITDAFNYNVVMHNLCGGSVSIQRNEEGFHALLNDIIPAGNFARVVNGTLFVIPLNAPNEKTKDIIERRKAFNHKALAIRFPGLEKKGTVFSKGYDIQYILRVISLGGEVPISFPNDLHFAVYANFKKVPFSKILSDIVYTNQCIIVERETGLEIIPWQVNQYNAYSSPVTAYEPLNLPPLKKKLITADPVYYDEKSGSGPYPPPLINDPSIYPAPVVRSMGYFSDENGHPIIIQPYPASNANFRNYPGDSE